MESVCEVENRFYYQNCEVKKNKKRNTEAEVAARLLIASGCIQGVLGGKFNILGGHSISHSNQKCVYAHVHVSYSERFAR
jgi:heme A synthase